MKKENLENNKKYVRNSLLTSLIMTVVILIIYGLVCIKIPLALIVMLVPNVFISIIKSIVCFIEYGFNKKTIWTEIGSLLIVLVFYLPFIGSGLFI